MWLIRHEPFWWGVHQAGECIFNHSLTPGRDILSMGGLQGRWRWTLFSARKTKCLQNLYKLGFILSFEIWPQDLLNAFLLAVSSSVLSLARDKQINLWLRRQSQENAHLSGLLSRLCGAGILLIFRGTGTGLRIAKFWVWGWDYLCKLALTCRSKHLRHIFHLQPNLVPSGALAISGCRA